MGSFQTQTCKISDCEQSELVTFLLQEEMIIIFKYKNIGF